MTDNNLIISFKSAKVFCNFEEIFFQHELLR